MIFFPRRNTQPVRTRSGRWHPRALWRRKSRFLKVLLIVRSLQQRADSASAVHLRHCTPTHVSSSGPGKAQKRASVVGNRESRPISEKEMAGWLLQVCVLNLRESQWPCSIFFFFLSFERWSLSGGASEKENAFNWASFFFLRLLEGRCRKWNGALFAVSLV